MLTMTSQKAEAELTDKQRNFIASLVAERNWEGADVLTVRVAKIVSRSEPNKPLVSFVGKKAASHAIDKLLKCPKNAPLVTTVTTTPTIATGIVTSTVTPSWAETKAQALELLTTVPAAYKGVKYAVKNTDPKSPNVWVFYEVKEYKGKRYLNRLTGSVGGWHRTFVSYKDYAGIIQRIKDSDYTTPEGEHLTGPMAAAALFSDMHGVCACCGAKLSNGKSIAQKFGPICVKKFS